MQNSLSLKIKGITNVKANLISECITERSNRKFAGSTLTQNFFSRNEDQDTFVPCSQSSLGNTTSRQEQNRRSLRKSRKKIEEVVQKLQPMKQREKVEIFSNSVAPSNAEDIQDVVILSPPRREPVETVITLREKPTRTSRKKTHKPIDQIVQVEVFADNKKSLNKTKNHHILLDLENTTSQLLFDDKEPSPSKQMKQTQQKSPEKSDVKTQQKPVLQKKEQLLIPKRAFMYEFNEEEESNQKQHEQLQKQTQTECKKEKQVVSLIKGSQFFDFSDPSAFKRRLFEEVPERVTLRMEVTRDNGGFNTFWPEFYLRFTSDKKGVLRAKKTSSRPTSTFLIGLHGQSIEQASPSYLGKVKSVGIGQCYNIYGPGLNPSDAKQQGVTPRQLLATLVYSTSLFHTNGPRKFSLYLLRPQFRYYRDFPQISMYGQEIPLSMLHGYPGNKDKIRLVHNRRPAWIQDIGGYLLNFRGMAPCPSIKNFILEDTNTQEIILFGKQTQNTFNLDVSASVSTFLAFAVAVTTFDNRLIFQ